VRGQDQDEVIYGLEEERNHKEMLFQSQYEQCEPCDDREEKNKVRQLRQTLRENRSQIDLNVRYLNQKVSELRMARGDESI